MVEESGTNEKLNFGREKVNRKKTMQGGGRESEKQLGRDESRKKLHGIGKRERRVRKSVVAELEVRMPRPRGAPAEQD